MNINQQVLLTTGSLTLTVRALLIKQSDTNRITRPRAGIMLFMPWLLITIIGLAPPAAHAATMLFKSNFGPGVSLGSPYNFSTKGAWQMISGTDKETGYKWPITALGANFSGVQLIAPEAMTPATVGNYITNEIRSVIGPNGKPINELSQIVKIKEPVGKSGAQAPLIIKRPYNIGDVTNLYITYWFKYPADLASKLDSTVSNADWRTQFEFKTGGYNATDGGDYRISTNIKKRADGVLYWRTKADNVANGPSFPQIDYWFEENHAVPVPVGEWFKYEVFWRRSSGSDGRFWSAVNGEVIVNYYGPTMGDYNLPITRIMVNNPYTGGNATVQSRSTGLEIWNGFPCGVGVSCYNYDAAAPSVPTSLVPKLSKFTSSAMVKLTWKASSDNVGVAGYYIYRNGTKIGVSTLTSFNDILAGTATGSVYSYTVKAFDAADNLSAASTLVSTVY